MRAFAKIWSSFIFARAWSVLLIATALSVLSVFAVGTLSVSTQIEGLMPQGTQSVKTLNAALRKTGSFASIQIVATADNPDTAEAFVREAKASFEKLDWVETAQYSEDVSVLERHKLLLLSREELVELENKFNAAFPNLVAQRISGAFGGAPVTFSLRSDGLVGSTDNELDPESLELLQTPVGASNTTERAFASDDRRTFVLVVWPRSGLESLTDSKRIIDDSREVVDKLALQPKFAELRTGVAGRIANKVTQFDSIIGDLRTGLITSILLISLILCVSYRSIAALPIIILPLAIGIFWTLAATALTVGGLNLITVFLTLILFGLGIDFGIHNFSRYLEERTAGASPQDALHVVMTETASASLMAAITTALAFFALTLTEFRAFTEFGIIAGMGIILTFASMYSVMPALMIIFERCGWRPKSRKIRQTPRKVRLNSLSRPRRAWFGLALLMVFTVIFAPKVAFERNIKNLEAQQPAALISATQDVKKVFSGGHDRAILVVETLDELSALDGHFSSYIEQDLETPTIKKVESVLDFAPTPNEQRARLEVIRRLQSRASQLQGLDQQKYDATLPYLSIADLNAMDLPPALLRTFLGDPDIPGYLMYIYNSVSMDDSETARLFYDDAARTDVGGQSYYSASEGFIFVEMLALMKADALKAIILVVLTTGLVIFTFVRKFIATLIILAPALFGVAITVAIMGAWGPNLSIMNMVILPSLIGISVDNCVHIYHRFIHAPRPVDIAAIMGSTGRAAALTTLTTLIGFGGMVTASMGGLRSMGLLAIIGFLTCLLVTWIALPLLLQRFYPHLTGASSQ